MKKTLIVMLAAACLAACSKPSPAMQMIETTAEALGGKARIQQINTLTLEGDGEAPNLGQNLTTDSELPVWKAAPYRRSIDVAAGRMRVRQTRTAQFLFAGATTQQLDQGVDGNVGYNMPQGQGGMPSRTSESVAKTRRVEMFHHPISLIRLALTPGTKVDNLRTFNNYEAVDVTTPQGDVLTFEVDATVKDANGELTAIPAQEKKRQVILRYLAATVFVSGVAYPEKEVNQRLAVHHPDVASLRRYLIEWRYMRRKAGIYELLPREDWPPA